MMGYSQEVRQRTLTPSFRWFESIYPNQLQQTIMGCRQVVRQRTLTPSFQRFESFHPSQVLALTEQFPFPKNAVVRKGFFYSF